MIYAVRIAFWKAWNNILIKVCLLPFRFLTADLVQNIQKYEMHCALLTTCTVVTAVKSMCKC